MMLSNSNKSLNRIEEDHETLEKDRYVSQEISQEEKELQYNSQD